MLTFIKKLIPVSVFRLIQPVYHFLLAWTSAVVYRFPGRHIKIVGITGTKGKTSTAELVNSLLESAGYKTALAGTLRFKVGKKSRPNLYKMTMPGRFFMQSFLRQAVNADCDWVVFEMTSEGAKQFRHKWIDLDALIFTNLAPEHIESHGSFEKYLSAKLSIAKNLENKFKKETYLIVNADDKYGKSFMNIKAAYVIPYRLKDGNPYKLKDDGIDLTFDGQKMSSSLLGKFNLYNIIGSLTFAKAIGINGAEMSQALLSLKEIKGRVELVYLPKDDQNAARQNFEVVVDYAHTQDSLNALYEAFPEKRKICVLGNTGGGRDKWKREGMAAIADEHCAEIILTNEDPYDEDPETIVNQMTGGIKKTPYKIIMDRREAIAEALSHARSGDVVLITGKGTDPYIMGVKGKKTPWSDSKVAEEELEKLFAKKNSRR